MIKIRTKKLAGGKQSLYLDIYFNGKRDYEFLNLYLTGDKQKDKELYSVAEKVMHRMEMELAACNYDIEIYRRNETDFIAYLGKMYDARPKYEKLKTVIKHLKGYCPGPLPFNKVTESWYEGFEEYLQERMKGSSINNIIIVLKMSLNQAVEDGILKKNPLKRVKKHKDYSKRVYLTFEEVKMLNETDCRFPIVKDAFLFSCYTGLRISDIEEITWGDIQDGQVQLKQQKTDELVYIPLAKSAVDILSRQPAGGTDDKIFSMPSRNSVFVGLKSWVSAAGIRKNVTFHSSRHTFATLSLKYGKNLATVSKLLGHTDIATTQIYAKIVDEEKQRTINSLPNL
ncbi:MAG: tyrosine-type recombinase/integrase [Bacteroidota bacterium]